MTASIYSVYMLRCADGSLYTGIATDVARRITEHQGNSRGAKYLRGRRPLELAFAHEVGDRARASRVEHQLKMMPKSDKEALVAGRMSFLDITACLPERQTSGSGGG